MPTECTLTRGRKKAEGRGLGHKEGTGGKGNFETKQVHSTVRRRGKGRCERTGKGKGERGGNDRMVLLKGPTKPKDVGKGMNGNLGLTNKEKKKNLAEKSEKKKLVHAGGGQGWRGDRGGSCTDRLKGQGEQGAE